MLMESGTLGLPSVQVSKTDQCGVASMCLCKKNYVKGSGHDQGDLCLVSMTDSPEPCQCPSAVLQQDMCPGLLKGTFGLGCEGIWVVIQWGVLVDL